MTQDNREADLRLAVSQRPDAVEARFGLATLLSEEGRRAEALSILRDGVMFASLREDRLELLANAMLAMDAFPEALEALQSASRLVPSDDRLRGRVGQLALQLQDGATATRQLFNQYAGRFDRHLAGLGYADPQNIERILLPYVERFDDSAIIDLGCGTGLMGGLLRRWASHLAGVDLSPAMLEQARSKHIYDTLIQGDVVDYLAGLAGTVSLIVAADVLVYMGDLNSLFAQVARTLATGGLFAFTVEKGEGAAFAVNPSKRYSHSETYVRQTAAAAGLAILVCEAASPRLDRGVPVEGLLLLTERL